MEKDKYVGKRLEGRYEIQALIGMGGMANVYKAFDVIDERVVAVKILRDEFLGNEEFLRRFKNESKAIAVLSHPNIVKVYDVSFTGKVHSIVMEHIDGITLKDYIERQGVLTWKEAIHFTLQILRALQHAHDKGIVHRDIKPHNIMLLQNGTIKVTDFGIARFARSEVKTITDRAIGSVHYISPEQAMGDNTDEKTDIYSVGVMLFEMLTGRLPFEADTAVSVAIKQIQTQAVRPTSINPSIPEGLEDITLRAMQKDASRRYQSAAAMIADIEKFKEDPSIHFQYKYLDAENDAARKKKLGRAIKNTREEDDLPVKRRTPYIPILTGVTMAFVLASAGFIFLMLRINNPFVRVEDEPVPTLVGVKLDTAVQQYSELFDIEVEIYDNNDEHAKGVIFEQKPRPGMDIKVGSVVTVKVSEGPREVILENFENQSSEQVFQKLIEDGLEPTEEREFSSEIDAGYVIYTNPGKGTTVTSGTPITVFVSQGPKEQLDNVPPEILGMTVEQATQYLEFTAFSIGNVSEEPSDRPPGTIIAMSPEGWQPAGTAIDVVVSRGGSVITIPIPLPDMHEELTVNIRDDDGVKIVSTTVDPDAENVWMAQIPGEFGERMVVHVFISTPTKEGRRYQDYLLEFDEQDQEGGRFTLENDRSDSSDFRP